MTDLDTLLRPLRDDRTALPPPEPVEVLQRRVAQRRTRRRATVAAAYVAIAIVAVVPFAVLRDRNTTVAPAAHDDPSGRALVATGQASGVGWELSVEFDADDHTVCAELRAADSKGRSCGPLAVSGLLAAGAAGPAGGPSLVYGAVPPDVATVRLVPATAAPADDIATVAASSRPSARLFVFERAPSMGAVTLVLLDGEGREIGRVADPVPPTP